MPLFNASKNLKSFWLSGNDIVVEDSPAGRLGLTVCYDLRFPELYQQLRFQHQAQALFSSFHFSIFFLLVILVHARTSPLTPEFRKKGPAGTVSFY